MAHDEKEIAYRQSIKVALLAAERDVGISEICGQCMMSPQMYSRFKSRLQLGPGPLGDLKKYVEKNGYWPPPDDRTLAGNKSAQSEWMTIAADDLRQLVKILDSDTLDDAFKSERFAYIIGSHHAKQQALAEVLTEALGAKIKKSL